ncbi:hypothetical protein Adt_36865 [Abeliophyllum distichum]|uniref:Uncharacterized protein n=1 Tax=Abeliophyllum distichum TaxID=126358 RepID=A0ABD1QJN3_9LAMI
MDCQLKYSSHFTAFRLNCKRKTLTLSKPHNSAMGKNRNKKKKNESGQMAMDVTSDDHTVTDVPQAMDTRETVAPKAFVGGSLRKMKMGRQMKRSKNVRKMKAIAKAISLNDKSEEKVLKNESKTLRTKFAKGLYE